MRRRLLMIVHGPYPVGEPRVAREALAALDAGWDVDVIAARRGTEPARETDAAGVRITRLPIEHDRGRGALSAAREYLGFTLLAAVAVARALPRRRWRVVHVHNPPDFLFFAALAPKLFGARVVFDVHDLAPDMFRMRFGGRRGGGIFDRILRTIERIATSLADSVVTVHEPYRRALAARGTDVGKIAVVMNSIDERLLPTTTPIRATDAFRVVYHGSITPAYGLATLIDSVVLLAGRIVDLRLEIYGEGDELQALRDRAAAADVDRSVWFSGKYLPHAEVLEAVAGADAGVVPNVPSDLNRYALSSKLFEYVALGIPVVCSDLPTLREHFSPQEILFYPAANANALADALAEIEAAPVAAAERAAAARRRYEAYRWAHSAARYTAILERLAS
jgi:glycosyltransferase involved in cell wall biosynthesis